jgi:hypothetical protein
VDDLILMVSGRVRQLSTSNQANKSFQPQGPAELPPSTPRNTRESRRKAFFSELGEFWAAPGDWNL